MADILVISEILVNTDATATFQPATNKMWFIKEGLVAAKDLDGADIAVTHATLGTLFANNHVADDDWSTRLNVGEQLRADFFYTIPEGWDLDVDEDITISTSDDVSVFLIGMEIDLVDDEVKVLFEDPREHADSDRSLQPASGKLWIIDFWSLAAADLTSSFWTIELQDGDSTPITEWDLQQTALDKGGSAGNQIDFFAKREEAGSGSGQPGVWVVPDTWTIEEDLSDSSGATVVINTAYGREYDDPTEVI